MIQYQFGDQSPVSRIKFSASIADARPIGAVADGKVLHNRTETAEAFGVSLPTLDVWVKDGCPVEEKGGKGREYKFYLPDVRDWREGIKRDQEAEEARRQEAQRQLSLEIVGESAEENPAVFSAKAKRDIYLAEIEGMKARRMRGELVEVDAMRVAVTELLKTFSGFMRGFPDNLGRRAGLLPDQIQVVDEMTRALWDELFAEAERQFAIKENPGKENPGDAG